MADDTPVEEQGAPEPVETQETAEPVATERSSSSADEAAARDAHSRLRESRET